MYKLDLRSWHIYTMLVVLSLAISLWSVYQDNVINDDGVWYLETAKLFASGEWTSAYNRYPWPFYPLLISLVSQASGLGLEYAAHLLNAILYALVVLFFVKLVQELGTERQVVIAAAIIILLYSSLNDYRSMIIRGPGYWAFFLLSVLLYIRYFLQPRWRYAIGWAASMLIATLFRVEGFILLLFLPLAALARMDITWPKRLRLIVQASTLLIVMGVVQLMFMAVAPQFSVMNAGRLGHLIYLLGDASSIMLQNLSEKASLIENTLLKTGSREYAIAVVISSVFVIFLLKSIKVLTPVYAILTVYAIKKRIVFRSSDAYPVWLWLITLNVFIVIAFLSKHFFLQGRYLVPLCLLLILPIPFALVSIYRQWSTAAERSLRKNWLFPAVCVFLLMVGVDGLVSFGPDKNYIKQAGAWVKVERGGGGTVFANDQVLLYYTGERGITARNNDYTWSHALSVIRGTADIDYYAIRVSRKHPGREREVEKILGKPVKRFENRRGDKVLVFAGKGTAGSS